MFATLLLGVPLAAQAGAPPLLGPNGGQLQAIDVSHASGRAQILAAEYTGFSGRPNVLVYGVDAAGTLLLQSNIPNAFGVKELYAIEGTRIAYRDASDYPRIMEASGGNWVEGPRLQPNYLGGTYRGFGTRVDLGGSRVAHLLPGNLDIRVQDLSTPGQAITEALLPVPAGHTHIDLALDQDLLVAISGRYVAATDGFEDVSVRVFENSATVGWTEVMPRITAPVGVDWTDQQLSADVSAGRIAIAGGRCGTAYLYERSGTSAFALTDTVQSSRQLEIAPGVCAGLSQVTLRGDELVLTTGPDRAGERYERVASGWAPREIARSDQGSLSNFLFAGDFLLSNATSGGIQTHSQITNPTVLEVTCPGPASNAPVLLSVSPPSTFDLRPLGVSMRVADAAGSYFLVVGAQLALRPLGSESRLCIGGRVRIFPQVVDPFFPLTFFDVDPLAAGLAPGSTVHFQGWQRTLGLAGGRTSNAIAITFAP